VERTGEGIRKSLRADEMDGSISQPEITGIKDKTVGGGRKNTMLTDILVEREKAHMKSDCWNTEITDRHPVQIMNVCPYF
jgi:hypothetical protein